MELGIGARVQASPEDVSRRRAAEREAHRVIIDFFRLDTRDELLTVSVENSVNKA